MPTVSKYHVFICGPMESVGGNFNVPLFDHVAKALRNAGCEVYNPAEKVDWDVLRKMEKKAQVDHRRRGMLRNCEWICDVADVILLLPGWERAPGAVAEQRLGLALGLTLRECPTILITDHMYGYDSPDSVRLELFETQGL